MYNPIPKDAPEWITDKAHFLGEDENTNRFNKILKQRTRFYAFRIGRSERTFYFKDQFLDDKACHFLQEAKRQNSRLVLKGYLSPASKGMHGFYVLTHFGLYRRRSSSKRPCVNPETGELSFYKLRTD